MFGKYPVTVEIFERRENNIFCKIDKARKLFKDQKWRYQLKKEKVLTRPIDPKHIFIDNKGRHRLRLYSPRSRIYTPIVIDHKTGNFISDSADTKEWEIMDIFDFWEKKRYGKASFIGQNLPLILVGVFAFAIIMFMVVYASIIAGVAHSAAVLGQQVLESGLASG